MDLRDPNRFRNRKPLSSTERLLGLPPHAPSVESPTSSATDELIEDDVVFFNDDYTEPNHNHASSSSSSSSPNRNHHHYNHKAFGFGPPDAFGILAALPENDASPNARNGSHVYKASVSASVSLSSSSSSSSSRMIPVIPRPPSDRFPSSSSSSAKYLQSAPVNVPILSPAMMNAARRQRDFDEEDDGEGDAVAEDEEMVPPHEIVARNSTQSPMLAYSVLEGVGRTLKGRDLRQVRNAVWRQTGFLG